MRAQIELLLEFCASVVSGTRMPTSALALVPGGSERYGYPLRTPRWVPLFLGIHPPLRLPDSQPTRPVSP